MTAVTDGAFKSNNIKTAAIIQKCGGRVLRPPPLYELFKMIPHFPFGSR